MWRKNSKTDAPFSHKSCRPGQRDRRRLSGSAPDVLPMMRLWRGRSARIATGGFMSEADTATRLERMPGKSKRLEQPLEFVRSGLALGGPRFTSRHLPSSTVCSRFTHQIETAQSFAKHGVSDIAASIRDDGACPFICGIRLQGIAAMSRDKTPSLILQF
jgi:hypothetical protein